MATTGPSTNAIEEAWRGAAPPSGAMTVVAQVAADGVVESRQLGGERVVERRRVVQRPLEGSLLDQCRDLLCRAPADGTQRAVQLVRRIAHPERIALAERLSELAEQ